MPRPKRPRKAATKPPAPPVPPPAAPATQTVSIDRALAIALDHQRAGRLAAAAEILGIILAQRPDHAAAAGHLGAVRQAQGDAAGAVDAYRAALARQPDTIEILVNLGIALNACGRLDEAIASLGRAIALRPDLPEAHNNLGCALRDQGRLDAAVAAWRRALALRPVYPMAHSNLISTLDMMDGVPLAEMQAERRRWAQAVRQAGAPRFTDWPNPPDAARRLRVGYVSPDLRYHAAAFAVAPILMNHDRAAVEVTCYSGAPREDAMSARLKARADRWQRTAGMGDAALAALIRADGIDVLVDLSGHSPGNRLTLFAAKPAPVQITAWGLPTGTGLAEIDALLADPILIPAADRPLFAESVIDLPCALAYAPPEFAPAPAARPARTAGHLTLGCFNRFTKVSAGTLALWRRVLAALPSARLLLKDKLFDHAAERARVGALFHAAGIAPERLDFLGATDHRRHLEAYHAVDLALDPFPQNGGITSFEALSMGVPVVTRIGATPLGRLGASILTAVGLPDFIAPDDDAYVAIVQRAAADPAALAALRSGLRARLAASPAGDAARYAAAVEATYRALWRRWCANRGARA